MATLNFQGWLHTFRKKTSRLSTRITARLGLIQLTRDEEFESHYEQFKHIEKTIRAFVKNLNIFVEHFENFLISLQNTSENLSDFYRDRSYQRELDDLRRKNKALACEHFHAFKRTIDRQVIAVASQLLQKFSAPHHLISKRSAKLLDYDSKSKVMESCRDLEKQAALRDQYVIAKDLYDRINNQLIEELPKFNRFALEIFRGCILVLIEARRNLLLSYTQQTSSLLESPLMMTYTASNVASSILMSCDVAANSSFEDRQSADIHAMLDEDRKDSGQTSGHDTRQNSGNDEGSSRPASGLSSDFDQVAANVRDISSTPLSQISETDVGDQKLHNFDEPDGTSTPIKHPTNKITKSGASSENELNTADEADVNRNFKPNGDTLEREYNQAKQSVIQEAIIKQQQSDKLSSEKNDGKRKKKRFPIYIASWPFVATGPNQLTIACGQPLKLIKDCDNCGNNEWSLVQDKRGQLGYVPSSYIERKD